MSDGGQAIAPEVVAKVGRLREAIRRAIVTQERREFVNVLRCLDDLTNPAIPREKEDMR